MSSLGQTRVLELSDSDATVTCARYAQHGVKILSARLQAWQVADPREWTEAARWATGRPCVTHILVVFADDLALVKDVFVCKGGIAHPHLLASQHCGRHPRDAQEAFVQKGKLVAGPPFPPVKSSSLKRPTGWKVGARMRLRRCRTDAHRTGTSVLPSSGGHTWDWSWLVDEWLFGCSKWCLLAWSRPLVSETCAGVDCDWP